MKRRMAWLAALALLAAALYAGVPRHADLRGFDPARMAERETLMWRHYYEGRYVALAADLYAGARRDFGFSPWDSARLALAAADAARRFQPSRNAAEATAALPSLVAYYRRLAGAAPQPVVAEAAARVELAWWQARREAVPPAAYGLLIARVWTLLYGVEGEAVAAAGVARAEAMAYRDAHAARMTEHDWAVIAGRLSQSYAQLKTAVAGPAP
jgi:hypothetical protein